MNIKQAKAIPIGRLVEHLGGREVHSKGQDVWYHSPFRPDEATPSFKVNLALNTWFDFGHREGGSIIDLWLDFHGLGRSDSQALKQTLEGLKIFAEGSPGNSNPRPSSNRIKPPARAPEKQNRFALAKEPDRIKLESLKAEIERRRVGNQLAQRYLRQSQFTDGETGKKYAGLAFGNDKGGWEVSVPNPQRGKTFKTALGAKSITTLGNPKAETVLLFEGFWDCLTWLQMCGETPPDQQIIVLNTLSYVKAAATQIIEGKERIKTVIFFQDNDKAGDDALAYLAELLEPEGFQVGTMNHLYATAKDLSDYWMDDATDHTLSSRHLLPKYMSLGVWAERDRERTLSSDQIKNRSANL